MNNIQSVCLELLIELDRICEKYDINYYIYGGTLLGAIRHGGFIPWDDDIDIVMFRNDYEKFIKVCNDSLNDKYYLQTIENEPLSLLSWGNLYKKDTAFIQSFVNKDCFQGISIDIFALDRVPNNKLNQKIYGFIHDILNSIFWERFIVNNKPNSFKRKVIRIVANITKIIPDIKYRKFHEKILTIYNTRKCSYVVHNSFRKFNKKIMPIKFFEKDCYLEFEGIKFKAPFEWKKILQDYYGEDFMQIPDKNNQISHQVDIIDCNNSWKKYI